MNAIHQKVVLLLSGEVKRLPVVRGAALRVRCRIGQVWVTASGEAQDYWLRAGDERVFSAGTVGLLAESVAGAAELELLAAPPGQKLRPKCAGLAVAG